LLLALLIVLAVKLYALAFLPETELVDAMYYLRQTEKVRESQRVNPQFMDTELPLYYVLVASVLSFLPLALPFTKLVPLAMTLAYVGMAYLFFRSLFGSRYKLPFLLALAWPTFTIFGSINYVDQFAALMVLTATHFFYQASQRPSGRNVWLAGFFTALIPLTKVNAALVFPPLFVGWLWAARKRFSLPALSLIALLFLSIALFWPLQRIAGENCLAKGLWGCGGIPALFGPKTQGWEKIRDIGGTVKAVQATREILPVEQTAFRALLDWWSFPPYSTLEAVLGPSITSNLAYLFLAFALALTALLSYGFYRFVRSREPAFKIMALAFLFSQFTTFQGIFFARGLSEYVRLTMPTIFLVAAMLAVAWWRLPGQVLPRLGKILVAIFIVYAVLYSVAFVFYFHGVYEKHAGLYAFADTLPKQSNIFSSTRHQQIEFLTGIRSSGKEELFGEPMSYALVDGVLKAGGFTHLAWTCYKDLVPRPIVDQLEASGRLKAIYTDTCTRVYEVVRHAP